MGEKSKEKGTRKRWEKHKKGKRKGGEAREHGFVRGKTQIELAKREGLIIERDK